MPRYDIAMILSIEADSYMEAVQLAKTVEKGFAATDGENLSAVFNYEHDNYGQRVLYLHPEDSADIDPYGGRPVGEAFNDPRCPQCERDRADCDCPDENENAYRAFCADPEHGQDYHA